MAHYTVMFFTPCHAALFVWFIALAIPFFGVVNDLMGAFCVTFET